MKWMYRVIEVDTPEKLQVELTEYGNAGWELVSVISRGIAKIVATLKVQAPYVLLLTLLTACGPTELTLIDQAELSSLEELQAWVDLVAELAPDPVKVQREASKLTVEIEPRGKVRSPDYDDGYPFGALDGSYALLAWQSCSQGHPTGSILAHLLGHKLGYDHRDAAWFGAGGVEQRVVQALCPQVVFDVHGVGYAGAKLEDVEPVTELAVAALASVYGKDLTALWPSVRVVVTDDVPAGLDGYASRGSITLRPHSCVGNGSLAHELAHLAAQYTTGDADGGHHDTRLFLDQCTSNACAYATVELVGRGLCDG